MRNEDSWKNVTLYTISQSICPYLWPSSVEKWMSRKQRQCSGSLPRQLNLETEEDGDTTACSCSLETWLQKEDCGKGLDLWDMYFQSVVSLSHFLEIAFPTCNGLWSCNHLNHSGMTLPRYIMAVMVEQKQRRTSCRDHAVECFSLYTDEEWEKSMSDIKKWFCQGCNIHEHGIVQLWVTQRHCLWKEKKFLKSAFFFQSCTLKQKYISSNSSQSLNHHS